MPRKKRIDPVEGSHMRSYWVVSPKLSSDVSGWRQASVLGHAAFMGWPLDHPIGHKFAHGIKPNNVILIARRYKSKPEIVGFGVVRGKFKRSIKGVKTPSDFDSARILKPFIPMSEAPERIRLIEALGHSRALAQLHPDPGDTDYKKAHALVCA